MLSNNNSNDVRANIKKPTGNAKNIHHIGMLISISTFDQIEIHYCCIETCLKKNILISVQLYLQLKIKFLYFFLRVWG